MYILRHYSFWGFLGRTSISVVINKKATRRKQRSAINYKVGKCGDRSGNIRWSNVASGLSCGFGPAECLNTHTGIESGLKRNDPANFRSPLCCSSFWKRHDSFVIRCSLCRRENRGCERIARIVAKKKSARVLFSCLYFSKKLLKL